MRRLGVGFDSAPGALAPNGFFCPGPSTLISPIRPTHGHIAISPTMRLIRDAFAVRERLGDPQVVPSFHCIFLPGMPPSMSPGRSESSFSRKLDSPMGLRQDLSGSALPLILPSVSSRARISGLIGSPLLRPVRLLVPLDGSDRAFIPATRTFTSRLSARQSPFPLLDITTTVSGSSVGGTLTHWNSS